MGSWIVSNLRQKRQKRVIACRHVTVCDNSATPQKRIKHIDMYVIGLVELHGITFAIAWSVW